MVRLGSGTNRNDDCLTPVCLDGERHVPRSAHWPPPGTPRQIRMAGGGELGNEIDEKWDLGDGSPNTTNRQIARRIMGEVC